MVFNAKVLLNDLRTAFDAQTATLAALAAAGDKSQARTLHKATLADTDALSSRSFAWTQTDDQELQSGFLRVTDTVAGRVVTLTLAVDSGDTRFIGDHVISISVTTINGTVDSRPTSLDLRPVTGVRLRLKKGVRYRMTIANTTAATTTGVVDAAFQLLGKRRRG